MPRPVSNPPNPFARAAGGYEVEWLGEPPPARVQVYEEDGVEAEPVDSWGDVGDEYTGIPARIEIELTVELAPKLTNEQLIIDRRTITYKRVIRPPSTLRMVQDTAVVPIVPVIVPPVAPPSEGVNGNTNQ